jgi:hypothetical protein
VIRLGENVNESDIVIVESSTGNERKEKTCFVAFISLRCVEWSGCDAQQRTPIPASTPIATDLLDATPKHNQSNSTN